MPPCTDAVHAALLARSLWLRLPLHLAVSHAVHKGWRSVRER
jgi:hypothetical protein